MSLTDAHNKMSKSDPNDASRINLLDNVETIFKKIAKAKTDSITAVTSNLQHRPEVTNLINIYS